MKKIIFLLVMIISTNTAYANALAGSEFGVGLLRLLGDVKVLLPLAGIPICCLAAAYCAIRKSMAEETDQIKWKKAIVNSGICAVIVVAASGLIAVITSYFA